MPVPIHLNGLNRACYGSGFDQWGMEAGAGVASRVGRLHKFWQTENNLFRLQVLKPPIIDVANPLVPQVDVRFDLLPFRKHSGADIISVEDEHPYVSTPLRNYPALFLDEAP